MKAAILAAAMAMGATAAQACDGLFKFEIKDGYVAKVLESCKGKYAPIKLTENDRWAMVDGDIYRSTMARNGTKQYVAIYRDVKKDGVYRTVLEIYKDPGIE